VCALVGAIHDIYSVRFLDSILMAFIDAINIESKKTITVNIVYCPYKLYTSASFSTGSETSVPRLYVIIWYGRSADYKITSHASWLTQFINIFTLLAQIGQLDWCLSQLIYRTTKFYVYNRFLLKPRNIYIKKTFERHTVQIYDYSTVYWFKSTV
jgi:hypothetical protein